MYGLLSFSKPVAQDNPTPKPVIKIVILLLYIILYNSDTIFKGIETELVLPNLSRE
jgi:hypothetical protein